MEAITQVNRYGPICRHIVGATVALVLGGCSGNDGPDVPTNQVRVERTPSSGPLGPGEVTWLSADVFDTAGNRVGCIHNVRWVNSDPTATQLVERGTGFVEVTAMAPGKSVITASCEHLQATLELTVITVPVDLVRVTPDTSAMLVGRTLPLDAFLYDSLHRPIEGRNVTWSTSNAAVASVDASGIVTAVAGGNVAISATSDGTTGQAWVIVVPPTTADWSMVTEDWTTYQGNNQHTGYVPAIVDPYVLQARWAVHLAPGKALTSAVTANGAAFVAANSGLGEPMVFAVHAATGATRWSVTPANVVEAHAPAVDNGTVYLQTSPYENSFLVALDAATGVERFRSPYANQAGSWFAPVIDDGTVFAGGGIAHSDVYAWNASDGSLKWHAQLIGMEDQTTPTLYNGTVLAHSGMVSRALTALNPATGLTVFEIVDPGNVSAGYNPSGAPAIGSLANALAIQNRRLLSFGLANRSIAWQVRGDFSGQVTVANGMLFVQHFFDRVEARREADGALLWQWRLTSGELDIWAPMIATRNILFVAGTDRTWALDIASHRPIWSHPAHGFLSLSKDGNLLIASRDGTLTAIRAR